MSRLPLAALGAFVTLTAAAHPAHAQPVAEPRAENRVGMTITGGYSMGWVFGVPIRYGEMQLAAHWTRQKGETGIDLGGVASLWRGETEAGRALTGLTLGARFVYRWEFLRLGVGIAAGQMGFRRSTRGDDPETALVFDPYLSAGLEPFRFDGHALFLEVQGHLVDLENPATTLAVGFRF